MKVCLAGHGAFGIKHLEAMSKIPGVEVVSLAGSNMESAREVAQQWKIPHWTANLGESLAQPGLDAVILTTPTQMHAAQGIECMRAGKHVMIEIPMADSVADSDRLVRTQKETGVVAMAGHTRRFNPSHQWIHKRIRAGELKVLQMDVQTYFFRRTNTNALGKPRSWTDHLLWHHACHTVDLFGYQTGESISRSFALQGPKHPTLGIAMDMSIGLKTAAGAICTLSLSFNNDGPLGTFFRYICDNGTFIARYDELLDGKNNSIDVSKVDVSMNGIELQDREFFAAIREGREPNASFGKTGAAVGGLAVRLLEGQTNIILRETGERSGRARQVVEFGKLQAAPEGFVRDFVRHGREPPGKAFGLPDPPQALIGIAIQQVGSAGAETLDQSLVEYSHVGGGEIEPLGPGRRHDMRRITHQEQAAEPQRFHHETAQRGDALLDGRPRDHRLGHIDRQAQTQLIPESAVGPRVHRLFRTALNVISAAGQRAHAAHCEAARMVRINQFVRRGRYVGEDAEPSEGVDPFECLHGRRRYAAPAYTVITVATDDVIAE
jgi:2-hydroxy-4-carboxymuconate semialdehyde hemiacetal dehydrogenase